MVSTIALILASAIMPLAKVTMQRMREAELRRALREMRTAIDKFKDAADLGQIARDRPQGRRRELSAGPGDAGQRRQRGRTTQTGRKLNSSAASRSIR